MRFTKSDGFYNFNHVQAEQIDNIITNQNDDIFVTVKSGETPNWLKNWVRSNNATVLRNKKHEITGMKLNNLVYNIGDYIVSVKEVADDDLHFLVVPARKIVFDQLFTANYLLKRESDPYVASNEYVASEEDLDNEEVEEPKDEELVENDEEEETTDWNGSYNHEEAKEDQIVSIDTINIPEREIILKLEDKFDNKELHDLAMASKTRKELAENVHFGSKAVGRWVRTTKHQDIKDHFDK